MILWRRNKKFRLGGNSFDSVRAKLHFIFIYDAVNKNCGLIKNNLRVLVSTHGEFFVSRVIVHFQEAKEDICSKWKGMWSDKWKRVKVSPQKKRLMWENATTRNKKTSQRLRDVTSANNLLPTFLFPFVARSNSCVWEIVTLFFRRPFCVCVCACVKWKAKKSGFLLWPSDAFLTRHFSSFKENGEKGCVAVTMVEMSVSVVLRPLAMRKLFLHS